MSKKKKPTVILPAVKILDAANEGVSIARLEDNMVVFVTGAVPGDVADLRVTKQKKSFMEAVPVKYHTYSPLRQEPFCSHFGLCGGCKWQQLRYEEQLRFKQQQVVDNLTRIGKVELPECMPILGSQKTEYYRNKLDYTFSATKWLTTEELKEAEGQEIDRRGLGFHLPGMWNRVLNIDHCYLQPDPSDQIRLGLMEFVRQQGYSCFDLEEQCGLMRSLMIRNAVSGDLMVLVQFGEHDADAHKAVMEFLKNTFPQITSLLYVVNQKRNDTFHDLDILCYHGEPHITEQMEGLRFRVGPKSFYQTNALQAYELYKVARDFAQLTGEELVYDLYTGTGTIAQFVAGKAKHVVGIEYVPSAIEDAKVNAQLNGIQNTDFYAGDIKDLLTDELVARHGKPEVVITDPPRAGMHPDVVAKLVEIAPQRIVYVSCNPTTQARDLQLMDAHYRVVKVQPVDMFPHTFHVENVVLLERREA